MYCALDMWGDTGVLWRDAGVLWRNTGVLWRDTGELGALYWRVHVHCIRDTGVLRVLYWCVHVHCIVHPIQCPSYAVLDSAYQPVGSSSKMAAPLYSEIPSLQQPNSDAAHTGDPEPYLCVSQIVGTQEHPHTEHLNLEHTHGGVCNSVSVV